MRPHIRRAFTVGTCMLAGVVWSGCSAKKQSEYVTGISTQVTVPRDLKSVRVEVAISGVQQFCRAYKVYDGKVILPRSLGTYAQNDPTASGPVTYTIVGVSEEYSDSSPNPLFDGTCTNSTIGQNNARILRRSRQPYVAEQILFLPMPLKYSCFDKNCGDDQTCKGGKCVSAVVDTPEKMFPRYTPDLSDGTGGTCFHTDLCMKAAAPVIAVDQASCLYAVPNTPDAPAPAFGQASPFSGPSSGDGVNVEVTFDGGLVKEVLDKDPDEGFTIPDPTKPQQFKLAPGLCDMVNGTNDPAHRITAVRASGTCQAKQLAQPICAADQLAAMGVDANGHVPDPPPAEVCGVVPLTTAPSALMLVVDDSNNAQKFYPALRKATLPAGDAGAVDEDDFIGVGLSAVLENQSLYSTTLGVFYTTNGSTASTCNAGTASADPTIGISQISSGTMANTITQLKAHDARADVTTADLEPALRGAYAELAKSAYQDDVGRAVIVISNNFDANPSCGPDAPQTLVANAKGDGILTYAMQLVKDPQVDVTSSTTPGNVIALAGGTAPMAYKLTGNAGAAARFKDVINNLATCAYELDTPATPLSSGDSLAYADPTTAATKSVTQFDADCTKLGGPGDGWGFVNDAPRAGRSRIFLCGSACSDYRTAVQNSLVYSGIYGKPAPSVPVFLKRACTTK